MPNSFEVVCSAPPSMFAYLKLEEKKEGELTQQKVEKTVQGNVFSNDRGEDQSKRGIKWK